MCWAAQSACLVDANEAADDVHHHELDLECLRACLELRKQALSDALTRVTGRCEAGPHACGSWTMCSAEYVNTSPLWSFLALRFMSAWALLMAVFCFLVCLRNSAALSVRWYSSMPPWPCPSSSRSTSLPRKNCSAATMIFVTCRFERRCALGETRRREAGRGNDVDRLGVVPHALVVQLDQHIQRHLGGNLVLVRDLAALSVAKDAWLVRAMP